MYTNLNCGKECFESECKNDYEEEKKKITVRGGIRTHAHIRGPEVSNSQYVSKV